MKKRIMAGVAGTIIVLAVAYFPSGGGKDETPNTIVFQGRELDSLQQAADYASWCGGVVLIDKDDAEVLVDHCDE